MSAVEVMDPCSLGEGHASHIAGWCCGAKLRQTDGRCRRRAGWGTDHVGAGPCRRHLGATRNHRVSARLVLAEQSAARSLADIGYEPVEHPVEVLADVAGQARALMGYFAAKVAELEELRYTSDGGTEQLRAEVALYERAIDRTGRLVAECAKLGLDERRVQIAEQVGEQIARLWRAAEDALVVFLEQHGFGAVEEFREAMPGILRSSYEAIDVTSREGAA